jgi:PHD finger-like domain-containing protein 5A
MARHQKDLYMCRNQPGQSPGYLCQHCDGRCPVCDSHANQEALVKLCDECAVRQQNKKGRCVICGAAGECLAYYCHECVLVERDRDGCPRVKNVSNQRRDAHHEAKKYAQAGA